MDKDQFDEWLQDPVTELVMKYLSDSIKEESEILAERIIGGAIIAEGEQVQVSTTCLVLQNIIEITLEEIEGFYDDRSTGEQGYH